LVSGDTDTEGAPRFVHDETVPPIPVDVWLHRKTFRFNAHQAVDVMLHAKRLPITLASAFPSSTTCTLGGYIQREVNWAAFRLELFPNWEKNERQPYPKVLTISRSGWKRYEPPFENLVRWTNALAAQAYGYEMHELCYVHSHFPTKSGYQLLKPAMKRKQIAKRRPEDYFHVDTKLIHENTVWASALAFRDLLRTPAHGGYDYVLVEGPAETPWIQEAKRLAVGVATVYVLTYIET